MIGENPAREYQCNIDDKIFSSGPVLGGHMRCHMAKNILDKEPLLAIGDCSEQPQPRPGYCLRVNPKKSWKLSRLMEKAQENPCPDCSKRFRSTRALFGHMKIHSRKDEESGDWCQGRSKGSGSMKSCRDLVMPVLDRERLNSSLSSIDVGLSKTKGDLLLSVLVDDEAMHITRRKRTPRIECDVDERTEGVVFSVANEFSSSIEDEEEQGNQAADLLITMSRGEADFNYSGLSIEPLRNNLAPDFFDVEKLKITEEFEYNTSHSRGYMRMDPKGVELEVPAGMLCGATEVAHKKLEAARSGEKPMCEVAMIDRDMMQLADSDWRGRAELGIEPGLNSYADKVCAEKSGVLGESGEENKYKSRDTKICKRDAPVDASQGIEGNHGCAKFESIKDYSEKANRHVCSVCQKSFSSGQALGGHKRAHYVKNPEAKAEMPKSAATQQRLADITNMVDL